MQRNETEIFLNLLAKKENYDNTKKQAILKETSSHGKWVTINGNHVLIKD